MFTIKEIIIYLNYKVLYIFNTKKLLFIILNIYSNYFKKKCKIYYIFKKKFQIINLFWDVKFFKN